MKRRAEVEGCVGRTLRVRFGAAAACAAALCAHAPSQGPAVADTSGGALDRALQQSTAKVREIEPYEDHSTWENAWNAESDHYVVRTTGSYWLGHDLASGLDVMRGYFLEALAIKGTPGPRASVWVMPNNGAYNAQGTNADQHSSFYGSFYAPQAEGSPVIAAFDNEPTLLRMQITHSAVHQFLATEFPGNTPPVWISEGLASYFALYWNYGWGLSEFERLRDAGRLPPLQTLLNDGIPAYTDRTHERFIELGMLFYYLFRFREDTRTTQPNEAEQRAPFRDYVLATLRGQDPSKLPVHTVLDDREALNKDFRSYAFPRG